MRPEAAAVAVATTSCHICGGQTFSQLFAKSGFDILKCASCAIVFTRIPSDFDVLSIYDESYFQGGQTDGWAGPTGGGG